MNNSLKSVPVLNTDLISPRCVVTPLNTEFTSFGEAFYSWVNSDGITSDKSLDCEMVRAFCYVNQRPFVILMSDDLLKNHHYFSTTEWFEKYLTQHNYYRVGRGDFYKLDEYNRPIALVTLSSSQKHNFTIRYEGDEEVGRVLLSLAAENILSDERAIEKPKFYEVVASEGMPMMGLGGGEELTIIENTIENERIALPEYYPFLEGGVNALFEDFLNSDESVLILMGPPGTGKTSAAASIVNTLNILPIYGKRSEVTLHKDFTSFIFKTSDRYMSDIAGTTAKERTNLFVDRNLIKSEYWYHPHINRTIEDKAPRVPMIVVEDADLLLSPRSTGNLSMAQLLNETDGISSNHDRKIVFTTNLSRKSDIEEALMRTGRCYDVIEFRLLTPEEAIAARKANGLPDFEETPVKDMSLADALRKPRKRIFVKNGKIGIGFNK